MKLGIIFGIIGMSILLISFFTSFFIQKYKKNKKNSVGFLFEEKIKANFKNLAKEEKYKFVEGGLFKYASNQHFDLDGILITNKVVFIIETKYYIGHLQGSCLSTEINLIKGKKEAKFKNPFTQNLKHIQHFYRLLGFKVPVFSLLVLPENTTYDIDDLQDWSLIANENEIKDLIKDVLGDMHEELDIVLDTRKAIVQILNDHRTASLKDIKKFGKIINTKNDK
ncbi:hypothetical protein MCSF7_01646 [Mycoplasmopsis columbina SF7]|uniref:NERD domain-containing protein n=1 Tax=Mycoplasmopsis columbina SF7 TaxID=1037410 RepID=F9UKB8_9BACT|nr:nuclease-related domain-containing protein [Mycoplasmopsis columbina]EGV00123.1 hypothetical protein MCSF7_01646 [Mycoplasmopsis columbina SF7]